MKLLSILSAMSSSNNRRRYSRIDRMYARTGRIPGVHGHWYAGEFHLIGGRKPNRTNPNTCYRGPTA